MKLITLMLICTSLTLFADFKFEKNDQVAIVGGGLADRMQHDGWLETMIQSQKPKLNLSFRNLGFSGDTITQRPRSKNFLIPERYLSHIKADVIFVMFGFNESFKGEAAIAKFQKDFSDMIDRYKALKFNGHSSSRFVLFSPIAHEDLKDVNLPNGEKNNLNLALYAKAISVVAKEKGVEFIDLYNISKSLYSIAKKPLTVNGVHLSEEGSRLIALEVSRKLFSQSLESKVNVEDLRATILKKNWLWHNRYRATDGNDIWGSRGKLTYAKGLSNEEVLFRELNILDVMTKNHDKIIWAQANGDVQPLTVENLPQKIKVESNVGGGSKSSDPSKEGVKDYIDGDDSVSKMNLMEGYKVNLFADEKNFPELVNPVQLKVDTKGRMWAAAWKSYPKWEPGNQLEDKLLIFPDENNDGVADKCITFATVHNPISFEFWNGGVVVVSAPDILFLKDTDGDDVADIRRILYQGIDSADTHHVANSMIYGPDGGIYFQRGNFHTTTVESPYGSGRPIYDPGLYRINPRTYEFNFIASNRGNSHGISFDHWGYMYITEATSGSCFQVVREEKGFVRKSLFKKEVRPVASNDIISTSNFPDSIQGHFMICNTIGYRGIKTYKLNYNSETAEVSAIKPGNNLIYSEDKNFRPTDTEFGKDGALYFSDWSNIIIGHMQHHVRDPLRDHKHGRIFRIVYEGKPLQKVITVDGEPIEKLLDNLMHPSSNVRYMTRIELSERKTDDVISKLEKWILKFDSNKKEDAHHLLEALWVYQQHNRKNLGLLRKVLKSPEIHARNAAKVVQHFWNGNAFKTTFNKILSNEKKFKIPTHLTGKSKLTKELYKLGASVYKRDSHCQTCHQEDGKGLVDIYPPLAGSDWLSVDETLIKMTLKGLYGPINVKGKVYKSSPPMTPFEGLLNDKEIAGVLTYIRNSWGNKGPMIDPVMVGKVREKIKNKFGFYNPQELKD